MIAWKIMHQKTATSFCLRKMLGAALSTCYYHWSPFLTDFLAFWIQHQWSVFYCEHKSTPRDVLFEIGSRAENFSGGKLALSVVEGAIFNQLNFNYWWNALYSFDSWKVNPIARFVNRCICQMSHHMVLIEWILTQPTHRSVILLSLIQWTNDIVSYPIYWTVKIWSVLNWSVTCSWSLLHCFPLCGFNVRQQTDEIHAQKDVMHWAGGWINQNIGCKSLSTSM